MGRLFFLFSFLFLHSTLWANDAEIRSLERIAQCENHFTSVSPYAKALERQARIREAALSLQNFLAQARRPEASSWLSSLRQTLSYQAIHLKGDSPESLTQPIHEVFAFYDSHPPQIIVQMDHHAQIYDAATGEFIRRIEAPKGRILSLEFPHASTRLLVTTWTGMHHRHYLLDRLDPHFQVKLEPHRKKITQVEITPDAPFIPIRFTNGDFEVRNLEGIRLDQLTRKRVKRAIYIRDSRIVLMKSDSTAELVNLRNPSTSLHLDHIDPDQVFDAEGFQNGYFALVSRKKFVFYDPNGKQISRAHSLPSGGNVSRTSDGTRAILRSRKIARLINPFTGRVLATFKDPTFIAVEKSPRLPERLFIRTPESSLVTEIDLDGNIKGKIRLVGSFYDAGERVSYRSVQRQLRIYAPSGKVKTRIPFPPRSGPWDEVGVSPDGGLWVLTHTDGTATLYDLNGERLSETFLLFDPQQVLPTGSEGEIFQIHDNVKVKFITGSDWILLHGETLGEVTLIRPTP